MFKQVSRFARFTLALGVSAFFTGAALAQFNAVAGRDYTPITPPQPTSGNSVVEVLEFFSYSCIHCYQVEPKIEKWVASLPADTKLVRVPMPGVVRGINSATMFYALEAMGLLDKLHYKVFEAVHKDNVIFANPQVRNQWLTKNGVDVAKFEAMERSFSIISKVENVTKLAQSHRVETTPTFVVNGKFAVPNQTNSDMTFRILDTLAFSERAAAKTAAPAGAPVKAPSPAKPAPTPAAKPAK